MTVKQLIEELASFPPDAEIKIYSNYSGCDHSIRGIFIDARRFGATVFLEAK